jgi:ribose transport system substrate-binding protein
MNSRKFLNPLRWLVLIALIAGVQSVFSNPNRTLAADKVKVFLSNSFMGNDWRVEMENVAAAVAKKEPFASRFDFKIINVENTPEAQAASLDNMIDQGAKVLLVDASSPTALNASIQRACDAGIIVISFDQVVTADCAYKIDSDFSKASVWGGLWLAKKMGGKGNVVFDRGLPGAPISKVLEDGGKSSFAKYPDIKIVCEFDGQYAEGPTEQGVTSCLAANPQVDAIYTQGYCTSAVRALKAANRPMVPMYCQAYNGNYIALLKEPGISGIVTANPPGLSALAMQTALDLLDGKKIENKQIRIDPPVYVTDTSIDIGTKVNKIEEGVVAFPDLPPGLTFPALPPGLTVTVTTDEAQGKEPGATAEATGIATAAATQAK